MSEILYATDSKPGDGPVRRVLVANRGEIAVRIIGTLKRLGIDTGFLGRRLAERSAATVTVSN